MSAKPISLCALFYGDHPKLAHRCLSSIWERLGDGHEVLQDFRLALNEVSPATREIIDWFVASAAEHYGLTTILFDMPVNACKYPVMRRMLFDAPSPPAEWVLWFDDDSYLDGETTGWWRQLLDASQNADMLGQVWFQRIQGQQWDWISRQKWFNPKVGPPPRRQFSFCTGGWWMLRSALMRKHDWPSVELRHRGGDSLLGELCRHQGLRIKKFDTGVRINADDRGRHSKSPRRGVDEKVLGMKPSSGDLSHQQFEYSCRVCSGEKKLTREN